MSGHSKWSTIKHKKAAEDTKRGKIFTRLAKEVTLASREGGGDPNFNPRLRLAVDKAKAANMPKDNIERAIKRGTGELEGAELVEMMYEGYAPHGVGLLIEVVTDNRNRSIAEIRSLLNKNGGNMAEAGAVAWQFTRKGYIEVTEYDDQDEIFLTAADAGAEDVQFEDGSASVTSAATDLAVVRDALEEAEYKISEYSLIYEPNLPLSLDHHEALQVMAVIEKLDDLDDVQNVYSSLDISDEVMAAMESGD
jgi:YebC/PmpR family DNA-binding regulatory protein